MCNSIVLAAGAGYSKPNIEPLQPLYMYERCISFEVCVVEKMDVVRSFHYILIYSLILRRAGCVLLLLRCYFISFCGCIDVICSG